MFNVDLFLKKFKKITPPEYEVRENVSEIIKNKTNLKIEVSLISFKNNIIYIKTTPIYKNEIFLKKELILKELKIKLPNIFVKNIL